MSKTDNGTCPPVRALLDKNADEIESLREKCEIRTIALQQACGFAQNLTRPSLEALNRWRVTLDWEKLPDDFSYSHE